MLPPKPAGQRRLGILGGSGVNLPHAEGDKITVETPYGTVTNILPLHREDDLCVFFVARHHSCSEGYTPPHEVPYRAIMWAMAHELLCDKIIALASVGSIRPDLFRIGDIAIPTDFIDFAYQRGTMTFWRNSDVGPFSGEKGRIHYTPCDDHDDLLWRKKVAATLFPFKEGPHTVCLRDVSDTEPEIVYAQANGPRFESRAEVRMLQGHGHLVGMTCASEWTLAGELGVPYAIVAMVDNLGNGLDSGIDGNFMTEYQKHRNEHFHTTAAILDQIGRKARELLF
ncbi:hypothetical protein FOZ61_003434 [Perkinsus olseni]|uniref:Nucleoside phosphorylase domain-containing protein n=1 Tax=Perkinsus olseni TaxID=32597 RepID=A0A7J6M4J2_PEROL|nr:hypothetical protein FOZ61_003434 [Perkinsus olseni]KAF4666080.1 hypothetical protein FOL46_003287 [Perkinsus olseni]